MAANGYLHLFRDDRFLNVTLYGTDPFMLRTGVAYTFGPHGSKGTRMGHDPM